MKPVFTMQPIEKSIFLAGPTPRSAEVLSWRQEALAILERLGFPGKVFVPEAADWAPHDHYDDQVHWEWEALNQATVVVFWVPRDMATLPAFTTNVEFGLLVASGKVVLGFPEGAPKMRYLEKLGARFGLTPFKTLQGTLEAAVKKATGVFGEAPRSQA